MSHTLRRTFGLLAILPLSLLPLAANSALAQQDEAKFPGLVLSHGDLFTNDVGTVMGVSVVNNTPNTVGAVGISCTFTAKGQPAGSAGTTIYNIVAGEKGQDQVHLMGPKADAATCSIISTAAPLN